MLLKISFETNRIHCYIWCWPEVCTSAKMIGNCEHVLSWLLELWNDLLESIGRIKLPFFWRCFQTDSWIENDNLSVDKNVDEQADSSSIRSRGSLHSTASGEHKGLPMPRLQPFSPGQVFNSSTGMQILVIPSKDDHVLEVNVTWQLGVESSNPLGTGYESTLWDNDLLSLRVNINSKETCGTRRVLAMEAPDSCINFSVQWGLCQLVYIATLVCFVSAIGFSPCSHIPASQQPTQGNKKQKIQIFGPLLYFCRAAERFVSCFLHILECRVGWCNYPNLEFFYVIIYRLFHTRARNITEHTTRHSLV